MNYHTFIARLGVGSAHPGGYSATLSLLDKLRGMESKQVLEVGCGTGRTAIEVAKLGHSVTAIDVQELMIEKAEKRAAAENVSVKWMVCDASHLPFQNNQFDIVVVESVTIFLPVEVSISEYYRVLKEDGTIYDREMMALETLTEQAKSKIKNFYGARVIPNSAHWEQLFRKASFKAITIQDVTRLEDEFTVSVVDIKDPYQFIDTDIFTDVVMMELSIANSELMMETSPHLAHGLIVAKK